MKRRKNIVNTILIVMIAAFSYGYGLSISANESALHSEAPELLLENDSIQAYAGKSEEVLLCDFQPQASTYAACTADNLH